MIHACGQVPEGPSGWTIDRACPPPPIVHSIAATHCQCAWRRGTHNGGAPGTMHQRRRCGTLGAVRLPFVAGGAIGTYSALSAIDCCVCLCFVGNNIGRGLSSVRAGVVTFNDAGTRCRHETMYSPTYRAEGTSHECPAHALGVLYTEREAASTRGSPSAIATAGTNAHAPS